MVEDPGERPTAAAEESQFPAMEWVKEPAAKVPWVWMKEFVTVMPAEGVRVSAGAARFMARLKKV
jgi:hypothetical protein